MEENDVLLVRFRANTERYERDVERARSYGSRKFREMRKDAENSASGIEKAMSGATKSLGSFGKGLLGGAVGALAVGGLDQIIGRVAALAKGVAEIGDNAKMAGLSNRAFQELGYVAQQNRIPVDALTEAMRELSLRAAEFSRTGTGSGADAFQLIGFTADELARKLKNPSDLLVEIVDRMQELDSVSRIRVFGELFGDEGGVKFLQLIERGADGIRRTIKEANALGLVLDDDIIRRADEIDRKFSKISATVGTALKGALVEVVGAMDDWLDRFNKIEEQATNNVELSLSGIYGQLNAAKTVLKDLEAISVGSPIDDMNIAEQRMEIERLTDEALKLRDILDRRNGYDENFVYKAGEDAKGAAKQLDSFNSSLSDTGSVANGAVSGINSAADAIRALKDEVPELAQSLAELDAKSRIDAVYQRAISLSQGQREIALANEMRGKALQSLDIKSATDDPTRYLSSVLASDKSKDHVDGMASAFADKLTKMLASMPADLKGSVTINSGYRSVERQQQLWIDALKKYGSPEAARKWVAPPGNSQHNKGNAADLGYGSDRARQWTHENAGKFGLSFPLPNENWHIEDADARRQSETADLERKTAAAQNQASAYQQITAGAREYIATQGTEQQALSMTTNAAARLRYEQEMLADAQRSGITLTDQQRQEIGKLAEGMARAEGDIEGFRLKQEEAKETARFFGQTMTDALTGILSGTMTAEEALQQLLQTLLKATLQALLMGEGPLANLFGAGGGEEKEGGVGFGGLFGSLLGGLFGFAAGGYTGDGGKDEPAGIVHRGEFVMNKAATARLGIDNLAALQDGALRGYAGGGYVGTAPAIRRPDLKAANSNTAAAPQITISAPITVNGSSGSPEQNSDLAVKMSKQLEATMRGVVASELLRQTRPGNFLNSRAR